MVVLMLLFAKGRKRERSSPSSSRHPKLETNINNNNKNHDQIITTINFATYVVYRNRERGWVRGRERRRETVMALQLNGKANGSLALTQKHMRFENEEK